MAYKSDFESENEDGAYGGGMPDDDTLEDIEFNARTQQTRRIAKKKNWITSRLCSALDKAKVKRMRLKN